MSNLNILGMSSITNSGTLEVMVADPNNPTLDIRTTLPVGGGGGGSYVGGLGIDVVTNAGTGTINNTGTIVQPAGTVANGITLHANLLQAPGAGTYSAASLSIYGGSTTLANTAGTGAAGTMLFDSGSAYNAVADAGGAGFASGGALLQGTSQALGAYVTFYAGQATNAVTNIGGQMTFQGANATGGETATGGGIVISPGVGSGAATLNTTGLFTVNNLPTTDPHQLGALWVLDTLTGAAAISQG